MNEIRVVLYDFLSEVSQGIVYMPCRPIVGDTIWMRYAVGKAPKAYEVKQVAWNVGMIEGCTWDCYAYVEEVPESPPV